MKSGDSSRYALAACAFVMVLTACNSGGAQVTPQGSMQGATSFDTAKSQTSVAHGTEKVSPDGIVYTPAHVRIVNSQYNLDLNNDGTTDFVITEGNSTVPSGCSGRGGPFYDVQGSLSLTAEGSNGFEVNGGDAAKLTGGSLIGASQSFASGASWIEDRFSEYDTHCVHYGGVIGNWPPPSRGYLGLAFLVEGEVHYGWAKITVDGKPLGQYLNATLTGYAYQTEAGKAIRAGKK